MKDDFDIETPNDFYGLDKGTFGELLTEAKQKGLIAAKVYYIILYYYILRYIVGILTFLWKYIIYWYNCVYF